MVVAVRSKRKKLWLCALKNLRRWGFHSGVNRSGRYACYCVFYAFVILYRCVLSEPGQQKIIIDTNQWISCFRSLSAIDNSQLFSPSVFIHCYRQSISMIDIDFYRLISIGFPIVDFHRLETPGHQRFWHPVIWQFLKAFLCYIVVHRDVNAQVHETLNVNMRNPSVLRNN